MDTIVYVDGFNLYYGTLKGTPYKWLNIFVLCNHLLQTHHQIVAIKYYTALVKARPQDPTQPQRQQTYLRALRTLPNTEIVLGQFLQSTLKMPVVNPAPNAARFITVTKTEEKGSDVNIATHMVHDAHLGRYEAAVVISNDSDLVEPIRIVRGELGKTVGILNPYKRPTSMLRQCATFVKPIREGVLAISQFPPQMIDAHGIIQKPVGW
jgi:uncharacterized LabA/DUF88 family protein